jgi:hypothetical protein
MKIASEQGYSESAEVTIPQLRVFKLEWESVQSLISAGFVVASEHPF